MKYILIISLGGGGAERQVSILSKIIPFKKIFLLESVNEYEIQNIPIQILSDTIHKKNILYKMACLPFFAARFSRQIEKNSTVISFMERANFVNIIAKLFTRHKAIICERIYPSCEFQHGLKRFQKHLIRWLYPFADQILVNATEIKQDLIQNFKIPEYKIQVIHNMFPIETIQTQAKEPIPTQFKNLFSNPVVFNLGRYADQKGQWHLINAFSKVHRHIPQAKLVLMGQGDLKPFLQTLISALNLTDSIHLFDFDPNPYKYLSKANVFVLSSLWEGFPNVVLEAMACGLPVISTDCFSGPREIIAPNTQSPKDPLSKIEYAAYGILVPTGSRNKLFNPELTPDEDLMADAIISVLQNPDEQAKLRQKSLIRVSDFSTEKIIPKWQEVLDPNV